MNDQDIPTNPAEPLPPAEGQATPEVEETEPETTDAPKTEGEEGQAAPEDEEEVDVEGTKLVLPKSLAQKIREGTLRQADYTRKTQTVAEQARAIEAKQAEIRAEETRLQERAKVQGEVFETKAELHYVDKQLSAYTDEAWRALQLQDQQNGTNETQAHIVRFNTLTAQRAKLAAEITGKEGKIALEEQQATAKRTEEARNAYLSRVAAARPVLEADIGWSQPLALKLEGFAKAADWAPPGVGGLTDPELEIMCQDARFVKLVYLASIGHAALKSQKSAVGTSKQPQAQPQPVRPVPASRAPATSGPSERDDMETWAAKRRAQKAEKAKKRA